jgi:hypothetical protein
MKMDLFDDKSKTWIASTIVELERRSSELLFITVSKDGYEKEFNENIQFPNPNKIDYCSNQISTRTDCDEKSKDKRIDKDKSIKICFGAGKDCGVAGYFLDSGFKKSKHE